MTAEGPFLEEDMEAGMVRHMADCLVAVEAVYCFGEGRQNTNRHALRGSVLLNFQHAR